VGEHVNGDVARHHHVASVGFLGENGHELGLHRVVDLDALVTALGVSFDRGLGLRFRFGRHFARRGLFVAPFDEAEADHVRTDRAAVVVALFEVVELVGIVADVACRRDARRNVERTVDVAEMSVHVP
jgi:hypothetical protein